MPPKERDLDWTDADRLSQLVREIHVELDGDRVLLNGRDVTKEIRTFDITTSIQYAADNPAVREQLVAWQRAAADGADVVTEGRDQATVVFPHAECKIFLTADEDERARRRHRDLVARGEQVTFDDVLAAQHIRDERDRTRPVGALRKAEDAIEVSTNGLTPQEVVARCLHANRERSRLQSVHRARAPGGARWPVAEGEPRSATARPAIVQRLAAQFPQQRFVLNGGLRTVSQAQEALAWSAGVMLGREAYHRPYVITELHQQLFDDGWQRPTERELLERMARYALREAPRASRSTPSRGTCSACMPARAARAPSGRGWLKVRASVTLRPDFFL